MSLRGWTPVWLRANGGLPALDWALVDGAFSEPFFEQTAQRAMQHPFNLAFAQRTPLGALDAFAADRAGVAPTGFVFHMSRCGSTLVAQMLAHLSSTIVVSEAQPLDALLRLRGRGPSDETLIGWLRGMISALAQPRFNERRLFVKFHAWHVLELPLIARAFPGVPWIFVFREPRAVLRSQARIAGAELDPAVTAPAALGLGATELERVGQDEYAARVIAAFCAAALRNAGEGRAAFVDYAALPEIVLSDVLRFFAVDADADDARRMREVARRDAKGGGVFRPRTGEPNVPGTLERLAAEFLEAPYRALCAGALQRASHAG